MIQLDRDGDVHVLRMEAGENRFSPDFLDEVNDALPADVAPDQLDDARTFCTNHAPEPTEENPR